MSEIKLCPFYPEDFLEILAQKDNVTLLANKIFSFMKKCTISGNFTTEKYHCSYTFYTFEALLEKVQVYCDENKVTSRKSFELTDDLMESVKEIIEDTNNSPDLKWTVLYENKEQGYLIKITLRV